jgi:hypothetical protein
VELRDWAALTAGASVAFAIALLVQVGATTPTPVAFLGASTLACVVLIIVGWRHRARLTVIFTTLRQEAGRTLIRVGVRNDGRQSATSAAVELLVPDDVSIQPCDEYGVPSGRGSVSQTPESVDNEHGSNYWNELREFTGRTSHLLHFWFGRDTGEVPVRLKITSPALRRQFVREETISMQAGATTGR